MSTKWAYAKEKFLLSYAINTQYCANYPVIPEMGHAHFRISALHYETYNRSTSMLVLHSVQVLYQFAVPVVLFYVSLYRDHPMTTSVRANSHQLVSVFNHQPVKRLSNYMRIRLACH